MTARWIGFATPVHIAAGGQQVLVHEQVWRVSPALFSSLRAQHGPAICDLTPRATLGGVMPMWPESLAPRHAGASA